MTAHDVRIAALYLLGAFWLGGTAASPVAKVLYAVVGVGYLAVARGGLLGWGRKRRIPPGSS